MVELRGQDVISGEGEKYVTVINPAEPHNLPCFFESNNVCTV
jgi:hypothetical protein